MDEKTKNCIDDCRRCADVCEETITHCLGMGGKHADDDHISLLKKCINFCRDAAAAMEANDPDQKDICAECAKICRECADSCESIDPNDQKMMDCAEECRSCANSCEEMANS